MEIENIYMGKKGPDVGSIKLDRCVGKT